MTRLPEVRTDRGQRDVRLDFFRGLSMFVIFIAHVPANPWFQFIPARFGFSSAAELFVFCSGVASGFAFGRPFFRHGAWRGTMRVLYRLWQVYWAHIGLVLALIAVSAIGLELTGIDYPARLGLAPFFADGARGVLNMMAMLFLPAYTDILPMYIVVLAMIPAMMALSKISPRLAIFASLAVWLLVNITRLNLPTAYNGDALWYFNPFAWQLLFFTGFAFAMGWLWVPNLRRGLLFQLCLGFVLVSIPLNFWAIVDNVAWIHDFREWLLPPGNQTFLSPLRLLHFLSLAYVVLVLVEPHRQVLAHLTPIIMVGQQSLATFLASTSLVWVAGMVLDQTGRDGLAVTLVNLGGVAFIIAVAAFIIAVAAITAAFRNDRAGPRKAESAPQPAERTASAEDASGMARPYPV